MTYDDTFISWCVEFIIEIEVEVCNIATMILEAAGCKCNINIIILTHFMHQVYVVWK